MEQSYKPKNGSHFAFPDEILNQQRNNALLKRLFVCRAGYFPRFNGHVTHRKSGVPNETILIYCTKGVGWFESYGQRWTISAGQLFFVLPEQPHAYGTDDEASWTIHWVHFEGEETAVFLNLLNITVQNPILTIGEQLSIIQLFHQIYDLCQLGYSETFLLNNASTLRQILSRIALQNTLTSPTEKGLNIEAILQFMHRNLDKNYTVSTFAKQANLSPSHFSRQFHQKTGYAPIDYFIRLKIQHATELLAASDMMVKEISRALGYEDAYYFSRLFKKIVGMSPKQYRQTKL